MKAENLKLDSMAEPETKKQIIEMIEKNINGTYFREARLNPFFEKCWELNEPKKFKEENNRFYKWLYTDLKSIL